MLEKWHSSRTCQRRNAHGHLITRGLAKDAMHMAISPHRTGSKVKLLSRVHLSCLSITPAKAGASHPLACTPRARPLWPWLGHRQNYCMTKLSLCTGSTPLASSLLLQSPPPTPIHASNVHSTARLAALLRRHKKLAEVTVYKQEAIPAFCQAIVQGCCRGIERIDFLHDETILTTERWLGHSKWPGPYLL